jgi:hypothetical protein
MSDQFSNHADQVSAPATHAVAVTPHDSNALTDIPKALYVGSGGTIVMRGVAGTADTTWNNVPSGTILPFRARHVRATGTTEARSSRRYRAGASRRARRDRCSRVSLPMADRSARWSSSSRRPPGHGH